MQYEQKYHKYKLKYLNLKNKQQTGGEKKILLKIGEKTFADISIGMVFNNIELSTDGQKYLTDMFTKFKENYITNMLKNIIEKTSGAGVKAYNTYTKSLQNTCDGNKNTDPKTECNEVIKTTVNPQTKLDVQIMTDIKNILKSVFLLAYYFILLYIKLNN